MMKKYLYTFGLILIAWTTCAQPGMDSSTFEPGSISSVDSQRIISIIGQPDSAGKIYGEGLRLENGFLFEKITPTPTNTPTETVSVPTSTNTPEEGTATPTVTSTPTETPLETASNTPKPTFTSIPESDFDLDGNQKIDIEDLKVLIDLMNKGEIDSIDFNNDGVVDEKDLFLLSEKWGKFVD